MMEVAVRHWDHQSRMEIGSALTGPVVCPPRTDRRNKQKACTTRPFFWGQEMQRRTPSATISMDQKAISDRWLRYI